MRINTRHLIYFLGTILNTVTLLGVDATFIFFREYSYPDKQLLHTLLPSDAVLF